MTLPEIMVAMVLLLVGVLATFVMLDVANDHASKASAREGATNLARELLETAHGKQFAQIGGTAWFQSSLQTIPNGSGTVTSSGAFATSNYAQSTTVSRRNVTYTVAATACSVDDGRDNYGSHPTTANWCTDSTSTGTSDGQAEDLKRVTTRVSWAIGGKTEQILQTATFSSNGAVIGPSVTNLVISNPSQYSSQTSPIVTANPFPSPPGNVTFTGTSVGAYDMKFTVNGVEQTTGVTNQGSGTWTFAWPITNLSDATYTVAAVAVDVLGTRGQPRSLPVQLNRGTPTAVANVAGGYNYVWTNTSPYNNPPSGQKALVVELRWDANAEGSVTGYEVQRSGSTVCGGSTSLATECLDLNPASSGTSTYTIKTWYRDAAGALQSISSTYNVTAPGGGTFPTQYWHTTGTSIPQTNCLNPAASGSTGSRKDAVSTYVPGTETTWTNAANGNNFAGCMAPFTQTVTMPATTNQMLFSGYLRNAGTVNCTLAVQVFKNGSVLNGVAGHGYGGSGTGFVIPANQTQPTLVNLTLSTTAQTFVAGDQLTINIAGFATNNSRSGNVCTSTTLYYNSSAHPVSTTLPLTASGGGGSALSQPAAPTGLTITVNGDGTRTLTWNAATGTPAPDFYRIYRDGQRYTSRRDTTGDTGQATVQWTDSATGGTSHTYYVTTVSDNLAESASMVSVTG